MECSVLMCMIYSMLDMRGRESEVGESGAFHSCCGLVLGVNS